MSYGLENDIVVNNLCQASFIADDAWTVRTAQQALRALRIVAPVVGNAVITEQIAASADRVVEGATLSESLRPHPEIPLTLVQMVAVGEESGTLGEMLARAADAMDEETNARLSRLLSLLEPLIMAILGVLVGGLVIAMYLPIFKLGAVI